MYVYRKTKKYLKFTLILGIICLIRVIPNQVYGQETSSRSLEKAAVVLDGHVLFKIGSFSRFSAPEKAEQINQALIDTLKYTNETSIDLVKVDNQITLQDTNSNSSRCYFGCQSV